MKTLLTACLLLVACFVTGQTKVTFKTVQPALTLKKNETHVVSILHAKSKREAGKPLDSASLRYEAVLTVIDSSEDALTFRWVYRVPKGAVETEELAALRKQYEGLEMIYKTDGVGTFQELVNWEAVRDYCFRLLDEAFASQPKDSTNTALEKTKAMFGTKAAVQAAFIKEIQLLHALYGQRFSTALEKSSTYMSVPITTDPVPAMVTMQLTAFSPSQYTVKTTQAIDKRAATPMFEQLFAKLGLTDEKTRQEAMKSLASFLMSDEGTYTMNAKTGLPLKAVYKRRAGAEGMQQIETYELVVK